MVIKSAMKSTEPGEAGGRAAELSERLSHVPRRPGVYLLKGPKEKVLYVGKAKDLRSRLRSYFQKSASLDMRKTAMMQRVRDFSHIVTETELEAYALEANLIKQYKPRYNVILRDDKNYPYLKLTVNEEWPRLEVVRRIQADGALYFGPFVPAGGMREALAFVRRNFGLRPCSYRLEKPRRPCIDFQMGRCPAPCAGKISREEYMRIVEEVLMFLKGRQGDLLEYLRGKMKRYSEQMRYEEAAEVRDRIRAVERSVQSQKVIAPELGDVDVLGFHVGEQGVAFQVFFVRGGVMIGARDFFLRDMEDMPLGELMRSFLLMLYSKEIIPPRDIILGVTPDEAQGLKAWLLERQIPQEEEVAGRKRAPKRKKAVRLTVPRKGKKRELLGMAEENARLVYEGRTRRDAGAALEELRERLGLESPPRSIGAFDVSNIAGSEAVGAFVCWAGGEFQKDHYRRVRIRSVEGIDDYGMMREVVGRVLEGVEIPDLIVIDGGRAHLEAALKVVEKIAGRKAREPAGPPPYVVSVAKKPDRLFTPASEEPVSLEDRRASSGLLKLVRDEVHRFAIAYHKKLRDRRAVSSPLETVPGIGAKRRLALLRRFGSIEAIKKATVEEIASVPGMNRKAAEALKESLGEG